MNEEDISGWIPPELIARAKIAAERDAATAERLARPKQKKPRRKREGLGAPEPRNPRFAFVMAGGAAAFLLAGRAAGFLMGSARGFGRGGVALIAVDWTSCLFTLLIYLKFMLPMKSHRAVLGVLLACKLASDAVFAAMSASPSEPRAPIFVLAAFMSSPLIFLLYGLLRRRSTEKAAGLLQLLIVATVLPIALFKNFSFQNVMKFLQAGCMVFLLVNWPVLSQAAGLGVRKKEVGGRDANET